MARRYKINKTKTNKSGFLFILLLLIILGIATYAVVNYQFDIRKRAVGIPPVALIHKPVCPGPQKDKFRCHSRIIVDPFGNPKTAYIPDGYGPNQFRTAYTLSGTVSSPQTIALVSAFDQPNILADLNTYSRAFNIPTLRSCLVSSGTNKAPCFQKVDQNGGSVYPQFDQAWALETTLDVEVAHAICQNCNLLLVEANTNSYSDLLNAVDRARLMGAHVISNSYGSSEFVGENSFDSHFNYTGLAIVYSSGDSGYGSSYPAGSQFVTAAGGTTLTINPDNSYNNEAVWSGTVSGCSLYEPKPSWQKDSFCTNRTIADISADADPNTGAAVYTSISYNGRKGWLKMGGTSLSAPIIAGVFALGGVPINGTANSLVYTLGTSSNLHDITSGSNGSCGTALCNAALGFDGPTGMGTPLGVKAF